VDEFRTYILIEGDLLDDVLDSIKNIAIEVGQDHGSCPNVDIRAEEFRRASRPAESYDEPSSPHIVCWRGDAERRRLRRKAEEALRLADDAGLALSIKLIEAALRVRIL